MTTTPKALPPSHLKRIDELGLDVISWRNNSVKTADGGEWLPQYITGPDRELIAWETNSNYAFPGYEAHHGSASSGRYEDIHGALAWLQWVRGGSIPFQTCG